MCSKHVLSTSRRLAAERGFGDDSETKQLHKYKSCVLCKVNIEVLYEFVNITCLSPFTSD